MPPKKTILKIDLVNPIQGIDLFIDLAAVIEEYLKALKIEPTGWTIEYIEDGPISRFQDAISDQFIGVHLARDIRA